MIPHKPRHDVRVYTLKISGELDHKDFAALFCPPETSVRIEDHVTIFSNLVTDQSGILGLIRNLHNLGCTLLELNCTD